jgi:RHH-type transcriptional regulator, rel operon repressor / antitoxin RelB
VRADTKTKAKLDKLAEATNRSKSFLAAEAIERYLEVEAWQINEIKQAIKEADAGDFVSDEEFTKLVKKYAG